MGHATPFPPMDAERRSRHQRLTRDRQAALLRGVVDRVTRAKKSVTPLIVFDLDGTLLDNRPRTCAIMGELAARWRESKPEQAGLLDRIRHDSLEYLLTDNLRSLGISADSDLAEAVEYWKSRFFYDALLGHDIPLDGAVQFARACYDAGGTLVYFTGRDLPNMALGTLASLRDNGFPIGVPGTELVLKPDPEMSDDEFKRTITPLLHRSGVVAAAFDNEPGNCNIFQELFPDTDVFLLDTQHLPGAPELDPKVHVIGDFGMEP
jgi:hypothetical protein